MTTDLQSPSTSYISTESWTSVGKYRYGIPPSSTASSPATCWPRASLRPVTLNYETSRAIPWPTASTGMIDRAFPQIQTQIQRQSRTWTPIPSISSTAASTTGFSGVTSVVHSHNLGTVVYGLCNSSGSMLRPTYQMAGFIGPHVPIFDAAAYYPAMPATKPQNLAVNHRYLGNALAALFDQPSDWSSTTTNNNGSTAVPAYRMVLRLRRVCRELRGRRVQVDPPVSEHQRADGGYSPARPDRLVSRLPQRS